MINKIAQRYSLMKGIGLFYMAVASVLLLGGIILALLLLRADFYADYRRGAHVVAAAFVFIPTVLTALGLFVQGSLANAVADIERTTRDNATAIEVNRAVAEKAVRTGQDAIKNSEAMLHAQTALAAAQRAELALAPPAIDVTETPVRTEPAALPSAGTPIDISAFAPPTMLPPVAPQSTPELDLVAPETHTQAERTADAIDSIDAIPEGVINEGGIVTHLPPPVDSSDVAVQNLFSRAKGAVIRTRRPWQRDASRPVVPSAE
jgi:hypothetical protein